MTTPPTSAPLSERIVIQFPRLGPYHIARIQAAHAYFQERGVEVVALEGAALDGLYAWREETVQTPFLRHQLFTGRNFHEVAPAALHQAVLQALDALNPEAVAIHSYGFPDARAALLWCRRNRRTAILMTDSRQEDVERRPLREAFKRRIVGQYDSAVVGGEPQRRYLVNLGFKRARVWDGYNVVDNAYFAAEVAAARNHAIQANLPGLTEEGPFFLASNRFIKRKNLPGLVRAYALYRSRTSTPWRLVLLGDGQEREQVEHLVAKHGIGGVTLAGFRQIDELPQYYARASAFIHAALSEQWGLVVNEALVCGLPVLVSKQTGSSEELVRHGENGYVFDATSEQEIATCMARISEMPEAQRVEMGRAGRQIVAAWGTERFARSLWEAYELKKEAPLRSHDWAVDTVFTLLNRFSRGVAALHTVES